MKKTAIGLVFLVVMSPCLAFTQQEEVSFDYLVWAPTDRSRANETMAQIYVQMTFRSEGDHKICDGPYVLSLTYKAIPYRPELFKAARASVQDLSFVPVTFELRQALKLAGKPSLYSLGEPGQLQFKVDPPFGATLSDVEFQVYNRADYEHMAAFRIPFCLVVD